jgi:hypothetical protein
MRLSHPEPVDCTVPCPLDERAAKLAAVSVALKDAAFEQVGLDKHSVLFRTRAACWAYRQHHRIVPGELDVW